MYRHYKTDFPNQVHQLLVTVSKHFHIGAKGQIRYQSKEMDVNLEKALQSEREHLVHYFLRDRFSGVYYVEIASSKNLIPINDFLLRAWMEKSNYSFCGVPQTLMITKIAQEYFADATKLCADFGIGQMNPPSGFASGMRHFHKWENWIRMCILPPSVLDNFSLWSPYVTAGICAREAEKTTRGAVRSKIETWRAGTAYVPEDDYADYLVKKYGSSVFKHSSQYPSPKEMVDRLGWTV